MRRHPVVVFVAVISISMSSSVRAAQDDRATPDVVAPSVTVDATQQIDVEETSAAEAEPAAAPFRFRWSLKGTGLLTQLPDAPALFPERNDATMLWRAREEPTFRPSAATTIDVAVEQWLRVSSSATGASRVLPPTTPAPYRVHQLVWGMGSWDGGELTTEVDRASIRVEHRAATVTVGRQAVGWGRGVLFGAIDLFAPFTPLEADREWRRGIDAAHADLRVNDRTSVDGVAAFGDAWDRSAFGARVRGFSETADLEVTGGWRARDVFFGVASSAPIGDAEIHGEAAVFRTPAVPGSLLFNQERTITKAVLGGSYRLPLGNGVVVAVEYHYSGFGVDDPSGILPALADPEFQQRYLRGDMQILGRHAAAEIASYEWSPELSLGLQSIQSATDGSGIVMPSATWTANDRLSVLISGYLPWGERPSAASFGSEFGVAPFGLLAQLRIYR